MAEAGANEDLEARITASDKRLAAPADLSTDFGAEGRDGDLTRLSYDFTLREGGGSLMRFDFTFVTEELTEFAGTEFNDALRIYLNGVQLAELTDGTALTVNQLLPAPFAAPHPDLMFNSAEDGPIRSDTRADAYTTPLSFMGRTQAGRNELVIEVEDMRDGLMDSAVLIKGGSIDLVDDDDSGVVTDPRPGDTADPVGIEIKSRSLTVKEGTAPVELAISLAGITGLTEDVTLKLTPTTADVDLGAGPGATTELTFAVGGPLTRTLQVSAPVDGIEETTEYVIATIDVSGGAAFAELPVAPVLIEVLDTTKDDNNPFEIELGDAPDRFSRRNPDAWSDAWTDAGVTISQSADLDSGDWIGINLGTRNPGNFGGSSLHAGDLGVSGRSGTGSTARPQEIDGAEGLRLALVDGLAGSALYGRLAGFEAGEAARLQLFADGSLIDTFHFNASDGATFDIESTAEFDTLIWSAGALTPLGDSFVFGALDDGLDPTGNMTSEFRLEALTLSGFEDQVF